MACDGGARLRRDVALMGGGFLDKLEDRLRDLEIARRVYLELGGDEVNGHVVDEQALLLAAPKKSMKLVVKRKTHEPYGTRMQALIAAFDEAGRGLTSREVIERTAPARRGPKNQRVYQTLLDARKRGFVKRNEVDGVYTLTGRRPA